MNDKSRSNLAFRLDERGEPSGAAETSDFCTPITRLLGGL